MRIEYIHAVQVFLGLASLSLFTTTATIASTHLPGLSSCPPSACVALAAAPAKVAMAERWR